MRLSRLTWLLALTLAAALLAAGCGSSKSSGTHKKHTKAKIAAGVGAAVIAHHEYKKHQAKKAAMSSSSTGQYRAGEFCSPKKESIYRSQHLVCSHGRLKKA